jgi:hypothetical protein
MKKIFILFLVFGLFMCSKCFSYEGTPREQTDQFFNDIMTGSVSESIDKLYSSNPTMADKPKELFDMKEQAALLTRFYGKPLGYEYVSVENKTDSVVKVTAVFKYEFHPVIWEFYFYKPLKKWMISHGFFNDQFGGL